MMLRVRAAAPLARVWQALTSASQLEVWLAEHAQVHLPLAFTFWGRYTPDGDVARQRLLYADGHTLRFIWTLGGEDITVEIHVEPDGADASVVSVSQTHVDFQQALAAAVAGEQILQRALQLVEKACRRSGVTWISAETPIEGNSGAARSSAATSA